MLPLAGSSAADPAMIFALATARSTTIAVLSSHPPVVASSGWIVLRGQATGVELACWYLVIVAALLPTAWLLSPSRRCRRARQAERDRYQHRADIKAADELWSDCPDCNSRCERRNQHSTPGIDPIAGHIRVVLQAKTTLEDLRSTPDPSTAKGLAMPAQHRTMLGYAPLRAPDLIARVEAERAAERTHPQWPTFTYFGRACVAAHATAARRSSRWRAHRAA
jgi:hypothetical protein